MITSVTINSGGIGYTSSIVPNVIPAAHKPIIEKIERIETIRGFSGIVTGISTVMIGGTLGLEFGLRAPSGQAFTDLVPTTPIYISDTSVGHGITSLNESGADDDVVAIGKTFVDNVYMVKEITSTSNNAAIKVNVHSGINTTSIDLAKFGLSFTVIFGSVGSGNTSYIMSGTHRDEFSTQTNLSNANNATIYVEKGDTLILENTTGGHQIGIKTDLSNATQVTNGITGAGTTLITWDTNTIAASDSIYYYYCTSHPNAMNGKIVVKQTEKGKFSWGYLAPDTASFSRANPIAIGVTGNTVIAGEGLGISTFPTIQRRGFGIRDTGAIKRSHTP